MKKILSLLLVGIMVVSMVPTVFATTDHSNGTQVVYDATADNDGDGQPDHAEAYTVTVPAKLAPGGSGDVVAEGTWGVNRKLVVTADEIVWLDCVIGTTATNEMKELDVTFPGIALVGSNTTSVTDTKVVSVADIENALFGTWSGCFFYDVEMVDLILFYIVDSNNGVMALTTAEPGMTWSEWIESEHNTGGFALNGEGYVVSSDGRGFDNPVKGTDLVSQNSHLVIVG